MNQKTITLALAVLSTVATVLLAVQGVLPPAWAALAGALGAGAYAIVRTYQKRASIDDWKSWLRTTEAWGVLLAIAAPVVAAIAGVLPATKAVPVAAVAAGLLKLARVLQAKLPGAPEGKTKDGGFGALGVLAWIAVIGAIVASMASRARADERAPQAVGCFDASNSWCVVPAQAVGWQVNLKTGGVRNAVMLTGIVLQHEFGSIPLGVGLYGGLGVSDESSSSYQGCFGLSVTSWGLACVGAQRASFASGGSAWQAMLTFAPQVTFGGTPSYVRAQ